MYQENGAHTTAPDWYGSGLTQVVLMILEYFTTKAPTAEAESGRRQNPFCPTLKWWHWSSYVNPDEHQEGREKDHPTTVTVFNLLPYQPSMANLEYTTLINISFSWSRWASFISFFSTGHTHSYIGHAARHIPFPKLFLAHFIRHDTNSWFICPTASITT